MTPQAPWMDWSAYRSLILECGVSEDDVAHVTDFLVNLGDIACASFPRPSLSCVSVSVSVSVCL